MVTDEASIGNIQTVIKVIHEVLWQLLLHFVEYFYLRGYSTCYALTCLIINMYLSGCYFE